MIRIEERAGGVIIQVKAVPNAKRTEIVGVLGEALKIRVAQPPEDGKANRAIETLLAETFHVAGWAVKVVGGASRPQKVVQIEGVGRDAILKILAAMSALG